MKMKSQFLVLLSVLALVAIPQLAGWSNGGHMTVAYIAYKNLTPKTQARVDQLIQMNPMYAAWTKGVSPDQQGIVAFVHAATWPDCIKQKACSPGYTSDGPDEGDTPPGTAHDDQNIGYSDKLMHKYWHFDDIPYEAPSAGKPPKHPNALSEIQLLTKAIGSGETDDIKSYDVVWLEHLVGDIHQPLHATSRFTKNHPNGDAGGNDVAFCAKPCQDELHAYWDGQLGESPSITQVTKVGTQLLAQKKPAAAATADPQVWANESFGLAKTVVYQAPISDDNDPSVKISPRPDPAYAQKAKTTAQLRVLLAGYRLANLLNTNLK